MRGEELTPSGGTAQREWRYLGAYNREGSPATGVAASREPALSRTHPLLDVAAILMLIGSLGAR